MNPFTFTEGSSLKPFEQAVESEMDKTVKHFEKELSKIRAGRAHSSLVDDLKVTYYGNTLPLKQIAAISAPEATLLVIQPWDANAIVDIEKALLASDLGLTPRNDGTVIRLQIPKLSSERREEFVKTINKRQEEAKVAVRSIRKEFHNHIRDAEKQKKISEDYSKKLDDTLQKITDKHIQALDKITQKKEEDIRTT